MLLHYNVYRTACHALCQAVAQITRVSISGMAFFSIESEVGTTTSSITDTTQSFLKHVPTHRALRTAQTS